MNIYSSNLKARLTCAIAWLTCSYQPPFLPQLWLTTESLSTTSLERSICLERPIFHVHHYWWRGNSRDSFNPGSSTIPQFMHFPLNRRGCKIPAWTQSYESTVSSLEKMFVQSGLLVNPYFWLGLMMKWRVMMENSHRSYPAYEVKTSRFQRQPSSPLFLVRVPVLVG